MGKIKRLPDFVSNRIAAGEVVERPASVVKELVENAIDAQATDIVIRIGSGGKELIEITDNGSGMSDDEMFLAVERHTTSKIESADDLDRILTLGFRGEALPSIASVSEMEILSRRSGDELGSFIAIDNGSIVDSGQKGTKEGTRIAVKRLFDKVPARRKFLKTDHTEFNHIWRMLQGLFLANHGISFRIFKDNKSFGEFPAREKMIDRIADIFGNDVSDNLVPIEALRGDTNLWGFVGQEGYFRGRGDMLFSVINGRPVQNRTIIAALRKGLGTILPHGKHPVAFLFLEISPDLVDVNVHPAKYEVRFRRDNIIFSIVQAAVKGAFSKEHFTEGNQPVRDSFSREPIRLRQDFQREIPLVLPQRKEIDPDKIYESYFKPGKKVEIRSHQVLESIGDTEAPSPTFFQVHNLFIIAETADGIVIVDQHAAHERVLYEKVMQRLKEGEKNSQQLLFPFDVSITPTQREILDRYGRLICKTGYEIMDTDSDYRIKIMAVPPFLRNFTDSTPFLEMLDEIYDGTSSATGEEAVMKNLASSMACKAAIKAGESLSQSEMSSLFSQLFATATPYVCPHGRPTVMRITMDKLLKDFKRV